MSDAVNLARLVRINDQLIELLKWAMESDKLDCAVLLAPITRAFTSILAEMGVTRKAYRLMREEAATGRLDPHIRHN